MSQLRSAKKAAAMRVLQLCARGITLKQFLRPLLDRLAESGFAVECACNDDPEAAEMRAGGYVVHSVRIAPSANLLALAGSLLQIRQLIRRGRFDIVHTHTSVAGFLGNIAARLARVPHLLYTQHGFYVHEGMSRAQRVLWGTIERLSIRLCDTMFCVSESERAGALARRMGPESKFVVTHGVGIDLRRFQRSPQEGERLRQRVRAELELGAEDRVVLTAARIVRDKGYYELIEALALLVQWDERVRLLAAGDGPEREGIEELARQRGLGDHLLLLGWRTDVPELLCAADVFVLATHHEGMPVSTMEAMASGLPVVATDIPGCREQVVEGETGLLVPVGSAQGLAAGLHTILNDDNLRHRMGEQGGRRAQRYGIEQALQAQMAVYERLRRRGGTGPD